MNYFLLLVVFFSSFDNPRDLFVGAEEVLPPIAYVNRTMYPPLMAYPVRPHLAMCILSDIQYADQDEKKRRHFRKSLDKLNHAVDEMNANRTHLDLVVHLGDLVDHSMERYLPTVEPVLRRIKYPFYQLLGNHDFLMTEETKFNTLFSKLGMPSRYYSLTCGENKAYRLVMLDGNDIAFYSTPTNSPQRKEAEGWLHMLKKRRAKNAQKFNGAIGSSQMSWLRNELREACNSSQRVLVLLHHPLRPRGEPTNLWNDLELVNVLGEYPCVIATLNGHAHKFLYDFHHTTVRDIHFVTFGGMVQSPFTSWGFVDVYEDVLHIHGLVFGRAIDFKYNISSSRTPSRVPLSSAGPSSSSAASEMATGAGGRFPVEVASVAPASASSYSKLTLVSQEQIEESMLAMYGGGGNVGGIHMLVLVAMAAVLAGTLVILWCRMKIRCCGRWRRR